MTVDSWSCVHWSLFGRSWLHLWSYRHSTFYLEVDQILVLVSAPHLTIMQFRCGFDFGAMHCDDFRFRPKLWVVLVLNNRKWPNAVVRFGSQCKQCRGRDRDLMLAAFFVFYCCLSLLSVILYSSMPVPVHAVPAESACSSCWMLTSQSQALSLASVSPGITATHTHSLSHLAAVSPDRMQTNCYFCRIVSVCSYLHINMSWWSDGRWNWESQWTWTNYVNVAVTVVWTSFVSRQLNSCWHLYFRMLR